MFIDDEKTYDIDSKEGHKNKKIFQINLPSENTDNYNN